MEYLKILQPLNGDYLNSRDGEWRGGALWTEVKTKKNANINGIDAVYSEAQECFIALVPLFGHRNIIIADDGEEKVKITVFTIKDEFIKRFRISSDDNILFLKELSEGDYKSIFDHRYLSVYKKAHELYGAKVQLNLFYAFDEKAQTCFSKRKGSFDLSMMTERYKDEFIKNAHWLKLAFHAESEFPDRPYKYASGEKVREDYVKIFREVSRFAGRECISNSTTVHWGEGNREVVKELRTLGIRSLTGYFEKDSMGNPLVSYYFDIPTLEHLGNRDFMMDTEADMIFGRIDRVLNIGSLSEVLKDVYEVSEDKHRGGFVSLMIHEQYFYDDYKNYIPDFEERVLDSCRILIEKGYKASFINDIIAEPEAKDSLLF